MAEEDYYVYSNQYVYKCDAWDYVESAIRQMLDELGYKNIDVKDMTDKYMQFISTQPLRFFVYSTIPAYLALSLSK